jgi:hypothetical protein
MAEEEIVKMKVDARSSLVHEVLCVFEAASKGIAGRGIFGCISSSLGERLIAV